MASIYQCEKSVNNPSTIQDVETSPLVDENGDPESIFKRALDSELEKICSFYQAKELEIYGEVTTLLKDEEAYVAEANGTDFEQADGLSNSRQGNKSERVRQGSIFRNVGFGRPRRSSNMSASLDDLEEDADSDDEADERAALHSGPSKERRRTDDANRTSSVDGLRNSRELPKLRRRSSQAYEDYSDHAFSVLYDTSITLKKRAIGLYVSLCELKSFIQLNKTGFSKALKKSDKILDSNLRSRYIDEVVNRAYPFRSTTMVYLDENIAKMEKLYAGISTQGDVSTAKKELRLHLREHVVWERNTVWREMIGIERKAQAANMGIRRTLLGRGNDPSNAQLQGDEPEIGTKELQTPLGRLRCPRWLFSSNFFTLLGILAVFVILLRSSVMEKREQQNCLAILAFVSLLWATEVRIGRAEGRLG